MSNKYIRTEDDNIIIFSLSLNHSDFKSFNPISAGTFYTNLVSDKNSDKTKMVVIISEPWSRSLNLKAKKDDDFHICAMLNKMYTEYGENNVKYITHEVAYPQLHKKK